MNQETNIKKTINTPIQDMVSNATKDSTIGPMIGSIIVVLLIIIGGFYYFGSILISKKNEIDLKNSFEQQGEEIKIEKAAKQSTNDDVNSIEADLKSTNIDNLDSSISDLDNEF